MFSSCKYVFLSVIPVLYFPKSCASEPVLPVLPPTLMLYSPGDPEYTEVLVKREHDNLTLVCELRGDPSLRNYVWNYVSNETLAERAYSVEPQGLSASSQLWKADLALSDSGQYMCSAPPFSVTKYILVQPKGPMSCARGAFWCGARCVLAAYVCDGRRDCLRGEDEAPALCRQDVCKGSDKLNCSSGRCIPAAACCRGAPLCRQPACCDEHPGRMQGFADEYPPLFEDRRAPDDYGFIQSTIYTVTACALIFMIAVVLLVSAICKMHMKRAALRGYGRAERATAAHYGAQYAQAHRFPPCYEASRLLEEGRASPPAAAPDSPPQDLCAPESPPPRGLARLSAAFAARYRQVPTQPEPVELQPVRPSSLQGSPARRPLADYRSPTYCELAAYGALGEAAAYGALGEAAALGALGEAADLNYMAAPVEFYRRSGRRNTLERVMDQLDRQRLTLQLGRFQLSLPRFGAPRPGTPDVPELRLRAGAGHTYTLNGRTIRLLGADIDCPVLPDGTVQPPSYTEAVRYKLYGPPPEYLSREGLNGRSADTVDREATANVEMPPCYEDLNAIHQFGVNGDDSNATVDDSNGNVNVITEDNRSNAATNVIIEADIDVQQNSSTQNDESRVETLSSIIDNLPAIDSDVNANDTENSPLNRPCVNLSVCDNVINNVNAINNNVICNE